MINTLKKNWVYVLFTCALFFFIITHFIQKDNTNIIKLSLKTIKINSGWGYEIYTNDTLYIKQLFVPGIAGFKTFKTEVDAQKTASLVIYKLHNKKIPSLTQHDLDSLGVQF